MYILIRIAFARNTVGLLCPSSRLASYGDVQIIRFLASFFQASPHSRSFTKHPFPNSSFSTGEDQKANTKVTPLFNGSILASSGIGKDDDIIPF